MDRVSFRPRPRPRLIRRPRPTSDEQAPSPILPTSAPAASSRRRPLDTRIIPFWLIEYLWNGLTALLLMASFAVGVIGNIGMFVWPNIPALGTIGVWQEWAWGDLAWAALYQLIVQSCQAYAARVYGRRSRLYALFLAVSVAPSLWTYGLVVVPWVVRVAAWLWADSWLVDLIAGGGAAVLLTFVLVANDVLQERRLIRDT